jgi:lantibiotic biosynthesis protein
MHTTLPNNIETMLRQLHRRIQKAVPANNGLMGGRLGLCMYYACLHQHTGRVTDANAAMAQLEQVLEETETRPMGYSYASGLAGLAYMMHYLRQTGLANAETDDYLRPLDELLYENALLQMQHRQNDFLHGAMGTVHYFTSRLPNAATEAPLTRLLTQFCSQAIEQPQGSWFESHIKISTTINGINLGLSHGQCGFLLLLLNAYEKGLLKNTIPAVVEKGIELILHYGQHAAGEATKYSCWPLTVNQPAGIPAWSARLAWCYGDLNVLLLLYRAAAVLQRPQWKTLADEKGAIIAGRTMTANTLVNDSHFCHGSSGLVQLYRCLHHYSPQAFYQAAYDYWLQRTLDYLPAELNSDVYNGKETNLLEGMVGVALVLLHAQGHGRTNWTQTLLLHG